VDPDLLARLLDEHAAPMELFAAQWTNAPEDSVPEAFVELARQRRPPRQPVAWLYRVVRNRAISAARSHRRRSRQEQLAADERPTWFARSNSELLDDKALTDGLRSLDDKHREVIVAKIWGGLTFEEIADVIGASRSAAHRRYEAGLELLRKELGLTWLTKSSSKTV
jgi:RNA polymerase sigma factor (sigma-70 family)